MIVEARSHETSISETFEIISAFVKYSRAIEMFTDWNVRQKLDRNLQFVVITLSTMKHSDETGSLQTCERQQYGKNAEK